MTTFYGHTKQDAGPEEWQPLKDHLEGVARLAERFAESFNADSWGRMAGVWHDLGKYKRSFQEYLEASQKNEDKNSKPSPSAKRVDHSTAGAKHAVETLHPVFGHLLAFAITGHHGGLLDSISDTACLQSRLEKDEDDYTPDFDIDAHTAELIPPQHLKEALGRPKTSAFSMAFFVRLLFSCLVDADFLDTEAFMDPERANNRPVWPKGVLSLMREEIERFMAELPSEDTPVNRLRNEVREACLQAAGGKQGIYSLTVPTGGGKTLSSLSFALKHAVAHHLDRIIYVIPFTSIIEQNADVFREVFRSLSSREGLDVVLEHHSNFDPEKETPTNRLATENWDAPLVVTTAVQFYESLFSNKTSRCRKLHNIANSVVILDEAQSLPVEYLNPCLAALKELTQTYGSTVVLCTATQPAIQKSEEFPIGLPECMEIIPQPRKLYSALKRVDVEPIGKTDDAELFQHISEHRQVLCIVNTRGHAKKLFDNIEDKKQTFHLSASMCPEHRTKVLSVIKQRLIENEPVKLISTQLIEAGVDIDFPVVFRSMAGIDSIAQAAGRCNRNGKLSLGKTFVFESEHVGSERFLKDTVNAATQIVSDKRYEDLLSLEAVEQYFRLYYWDQKDSWDKKDVLGKFKTQRSKDLPFLFSFKTVGRDFRLIDTVGKPIIVPWGEEGKRLAEMLWSKSEFPDRTVRRKLQRYTVQIPERVWNQHLDRAFQLLWETFPVLINESMHYSEDTGLNLEGDQGPLLCI